MTACAGARLPAPSSLDAALKLCSLSVSGVPGWSTCILVEVGSAPQLLVPAARR